MKQEVVLVKTMKQEVAVDSNLLLADLYETWRMGVIDHDDYQYGIGW